MWIEVSNKLYEKKAMLMGSSKQLEFLKKVDFLLTYEKNGEG